MKKSIMIAGFAFGAIVFGVSDVQAQATSIASPKTVNINLSDVIAIANGSVAAGGIVDFNFITADDYNEGKSKTVNKSLIVTSTTNFDVSVKADGSHFGLAGANGIPVGILSIKRASNNTPNPMTGISSLVVLSTSNQKLISAASFGSAKTLDIEYEIPGAQSIAHLFGRAAGAYTQSITYTATAL